MRVLINKWFRATFVLGAFSLISFPLYGQTSSITQEGEREARKLVNNKFSKCGDSWFIGYSAVGTDPGVILEIKGLTSSFVRAMPTQSEQLNGIQAKGDIILSFTSIRSSTEWYPEWSSWGTSSKGGWLSSPSRVFSTKKRGNWNASLKNFHYVNCAIAKVPNAYWQKRNENKLSESDREMFANLEREGLIISRNPIPRIDFIRSLYKQLRHSDLRDFYFTYNGGVIVLRSGGSAMASTDVDRSLLNILTNASFGMYRITNPIKESWVVTKQVNNSSTEFFYSPDVENSDQYKSFRNQMAPLLAQQAKKVGWCESVLNFTSLGFSNESIELNQERAFVGIYKFGCESSKPAEYWYICYCNTTIQKEVERIFAEGWVPDFSYTPEGKGYLILYGKNGFTENNIPTDLKLALTKLNNEDKRIIKVRVAPDGSWIILTR